DEDSEDDDDTDDKDSEDDDDSEEEEHEEEEEDIETKRERLRRWGEFIAAILICYVQLRAYSSCHSILSSSHEFCTSCS
ncbi:hypothetical protein MKW94_016672, partial [Papaver nudicaule]|nr:hypothetical protein [Papaver nudicaule]